MKSLGLLLANARSIKGKINELKCLLVEYDVLCVTETHIDSSIHSSSTLDVNDKEIYRKDRNIYGGGVMIAVQSEMNHSRVGLGLEFDMQFVIVKIEQSYDSREKFDHSVHL